MRPISFLPASLLFVACTSCAFAQALPPSDDAPAFVKTLIAQFEAAPRTNPPARIVRHRWHEQTVYYVPPRCCDVPGALYDAQGPRLCEPDGGFVGGGDGRCPDFRDKRGDEHLVWKDARQGKS